MFGGPIESCHYIVQCLDGSIGCLTLDSCIVVAPKEAFSYSYVVGEYRVRLCSTTTYPSH